MLVIRLLRIGKKNQPFFLVVVTDKRNAPRAGRFVEKLGFLNPLTKETSFKKERIKYWMEKGAKCSDTVHNLLIKEKILEGKKIPLHKKKKQEKIEAETQAKPTEKVEKKPEPEEKKEKKPELEKKPEEKPEEKKEEKKEEKPAKKEEKPAKVEKEKVEKEEKKETERS